MKVGPDYVLPPNRKVLMLFSSPEMSRSMCVSDCAEGKRLLKAATFTPALRGARDAFLQHIKQCSICNKDVTADGLDSSNTRRSQSH